MNYNVAVDRTGEVLASFKTRPEAGRWINENFTKKGQRRKDSSICTLPYVVRIERAKPYEAVLFDIKGNEKLRGTVESIAKKLNVGHGEMFQLMQDKYLNLPHYKDWHIERQYI